MSPIAVNQAALRLMTREFTPEEIGTFKLMMASFSDKLALLEAPILSHQDNAELFNALSSSL